MDHERELLEIIKEVSALQAVVLKLGEVLDRVDGDARGLKETGARSQEQIAHLDKDRARLFQLVREAEADIKDIQIWLGRIRQKLGLGGKGDVVMGDKVEVSGSDISGSNVGTGGQKSGPPPEWPKYLIFGVILAGVILLVGWLGVSVVTKWGEITPHSNSEPAD